MPTKRLLHTLMLGPAAVLLTQAAQTEPAIYQDDILSIAVGAVISQEGNVYYGDIQLSRSSDGRFTITAASERPLVNIDSVDVQIMESFPVQVSLAIAGSKSVPCVDLEEAAVVRQGNAFTVVMAETVLGPAESCIAVIDPFEATLSLDVAGLAADTYTVDVNGVETEFTLDLDNTGL
ncbi:MAG: hypothetical protein WD601_01455 [Pseudohongiellaceae bacterium]